MTRSRPGLIAVLVLAVGLSLLGVAVTPIANGAAQAETVDLTFETAPDGEPWDDPAETDFGHLAFSVYTPHDDEERPAIARDVPTPDDPPVSRTVIANQNADREAGWLNVRFQDQQPGPELVLWLDPHDERIDETGTSNELVVRGYDSSNERIYETRSQLTAGGYVFVRVQPERATDRVSRVAIAVRPPTGPGFSRFYVNRVSFTAASPEVDITVSPTQPQAGERPTIRALTGTPAAITAYEWSVDGARYRPPTEREDTRTISPRLSAGSHTVSVQVTDRFGREASASRTVTVRSAPTVTNAVVFLAAGGAVVVGVVALTYAIVRRRR